MLVVPQSDTTYISSLLLNEKGQIKILPTSDIRQIPFEGLALWMHRKAVYVLPTVELIDVTRDEIGALKAIEICAGNGALGRALGIPRTDSFWQESSEGQLIMKMAMNHSTTKPPPDVEKLDAIQAMNIYNPDVIIGSYVTQKYKKGDVLGVDGSSVYGVDEMRISRNVKKYIKVGNDTTHGNMRIMALPHKTIRGDFIVTKIPKELNQNAIYIFNF